MTIDIVSLGLTNAEFTKILGKVLSRPTIFSLPKFIIKAAIGEELANAAILSSTRVVPTRLVKIGYQFRFPCLELAGKIILLMMAATFLCKSCKIKFQVIGISTRKDPKYCPYCGGDSIEGDNIILC